MFQVGEKILLHEKQHMKILKWELIQLKYAFLIQFPPSEMLPEWFIPENSLTHFNHLFQKKQMNKLFTSKYRNLHDRPVILITL